MAEQVLLEFRAGKMVLHESQVCADARRGLCRILRGEEGLLHFQWLDRTSQQLEDDHIVFPEEAVFEKVQQSAGRVFILRFKHDQRKLFFWLQEPRAEGDVELCASVNRYINMPLQMEDDDEAIPDSVGGGRPGFLLETSGAREAVGASGYAKHPVQLADLQRILSNIGQTSGAGSDMSVLARDPGPSLSEVLKVDNLLPLLENCQLEERLSQFLPEGDWALESIVELLKSPQFRQQLDMFTLALRSGQMDLSQFGIDPSKCDFTVASFLEAIEDQVAIKMEETKTDDMDE